MSFGLPEPGPREPSPGPDTLVCSAKGCRATAAHALLWNNPKLHDTERRKVWLACEEHLTYLSDFLSLRGFLKEVIPPDQLTDAHG